MSDTKNVVLTPEPPRYKLELPDINRHWQTKSGYPEWLGWLVNHLASRTFTAAVSLPQTEARPDPAAAALTLHADLLAAVPKDAEPGKLKLAVWEVMLGKILPEKTKDIAGGNDIAELLARVLKLRNTKELGGRVTSHDWTELEDDIEEAANMLGEAVDKTTPQAEREQRRCLFYTLGVIRYAAQKNTHAALAGATQKNRHVAVANAARETLNAMECINTPHAVQSFAEALKDALSKPR